MKQLTFYQYATGLLILLNIALVVFLFFGRPHAAPERRAKGDSFRPRAIEMLRLDTQQQAAFGQLADQHRRQMRAIDKQQRAQLRSYFHSLIDSTHLADTAAITREVAQLERDKVAVTYQHFQEVRALLTQEQLPDFEKFIQRALDVLLLDKKGRRPPSRTDAE